jgi:hypothetical protein
MMRTLLAEAVVVTQRMIRTLLAEAVVIIVVAEMMAWTPVAEAEQLHELEAETMIRVPAAEATPMKRLQQGFGRAAAISDQRRSDGDDWGRWHGDPCGRRRAGASECPEQDAVQQHAAYRSGSSHGSLEG